MHVLLGLLVATVILAGCGSTTPTDPQPANPTTTTAVAPTNLATAEQRAKALAAVPAAIATVAPAKRQAACSSYVAGKDAFLAAFKVRFDAQFTPITTDELTTVGGTLDRLCTG